MKTKRQNKASRTWLLKGRERHRAEDSAYQAIFIVPSRKKHDSGWMLMVIVGVLPDGSYEKAAWCDDICWNIQTRKEYSMRCDCTYPGGILHFWGATFTVGSSLSSTDIVVTERIREAAKAAVS